MERILTRMTQITETAHFANDLGLDSLDTVEVVMAIEEVGNPRQHRAREAQWR